MRYLLITQEWKLNCPRPWCRSNE
ncbi:hypothetical protein NC651_039213 [Populus alba x Populus x berolinensis]|nr:hypothetical protein NC651_039213 [Populus alba x Populus x berolinensis]